MYEETTSMFDAAERDWRAMARVGRICERVRSGKTRWYLDFSPYLAGVERRLFSDRGHTFESREHAEAILSQIQGIHGRGVPLADAVAGYRQQRARPNLIGSKLRLWLAELEEEGEHAPDTLQYYRSYAKDDGHIGEFWAKRSIYEVTWDALREWIAWLRARHLAPKTIKNVLACFRGFYRWARRGHERELPDIEFPTVKPGPKKREKLMPLDDRARVIACVRERDRGIFIAMKMGIRPGEARAALVGDYDFASGRLSIYEALKGKGAGAPRGDTKNGEPGVYEVTPELRDWIEQHANDRRLQPNSPLFPNPNTGNPYASKRLRTIWLAVCTAAEVDYVSPYRSTKHSSFTWLHEDGVPKEDIQALARHRDPRSTDRYVQEHDARRRRAMERLEELERRAAGRQPGDRAPVATIGPKPRDFGA
jgi:integrase